MESELSEEKIPGMWLMESVFQCQKFYKYYSHRHLNCFLSQDRICFDSFLPHSSPSSKHQFNINCHLLEYNKVLWAVSQLSYPRSDLRSTHLFTSKVNSFYVFKLKMRVRTTEWAVHFHNVTQVDEANMIGLIISVDSFLSRGDNTVRCGATDQYNTQ